MSELPDPLSELWQSFQQGYRKTRQTQQFLGELFPKFEWVVILISLPWLVILHYNVGRRIISLLNLSFAGGLLMLLCLFFEEDWCVVLVATLYILGLIQYLKAIRRNDSHSLTTGVPWIANLHPVINQPMIAVTLESLFLLLLGQLTQHLWDVGIILHIQAVCLFLGQLFASVRKQRTAIDRNDQRIQAEEDARKTAKHHNSPTVFHQVQAPQHQQKRNP